MTGRIPAVAFLLAMACGAASPAPPHPRVPALDAMIGALGGAGRIAALRSLEVEAACLGPDGPFHTTIRSVRPGKVAFLQTKGSRTTDLRSTPARTWSIDENGQAQAQPAAVRAFARGHEFHLLLFEVYERFHDFRAAGRRMVDGRPCLGIDMVDENSRPASLCLDETSHFPLSLALHPEGAEGTVTLLLHDWAPVRGLQFFWSFTLTEGTRGFRYDYVGVRPDAVSEDLFPPPPAGEKPE